LSFRGNAYVEGIFESWGVATALRGGRENLHFEKGGRNMVMDAYLLGHVSDILHYSTPTVDLPQTAEDWDEFWVNFGCYADHPALVVFEKLKACGLHRDSVERMGHAINFVNFLLQAQSVHSRASNAWEGPNTISSLYEIVVAGLTSGAIPRSEGSKEATNETRRAEISTLFGLRDNEFKKHPLTPFWVAASRALKVDAYDRDSILAMRRCTAAESATYILQSVLEPRLSNIRTSFFATGDGLCGISLPGAQVGDIVAIIFQGSSFEMPAILREEKENRYSFVCVANVPDEWRVLSRSGGSLKHKEIVLV
jgi:hypothetical protein